MKRLFGSVVVLATMVGLAGSASAARVQGCCVTDGPCLLVPDEQVACLQSGGDFITAASGAGCVVTSAAPGTTTTRCTCDGLGDLSGPNLVDALARLGLCRQLPKGRVCNCPVASVPTATPTPTPPPPPLPTFTAATPATPEPVGCCQFAGLSRSCRQTTITDCKRPGRPAVFVQNANCTTAGLCLIIPNPNETPMPRVPLRRLRPGRVTGPRRP